MSGQLTTQGANCVESVEDVGILRWGWKVSAVATNVKETWNQQFDFLSWWVALLRNASKKHCRVQPLLLDWVPGIPKPAGFSPPGDYILQPGPDVCGGADEFTCGVRICFESYSCTITIRKLPDWRKAAACLIFACLWSEVGHAQPMDIIVWYGDVTADGFHLLGDEVEIQGWDDWPGRFLRFHVGADQGHWLPPHVAHGTDLRLGLVAGRLARGDGAGREQRGAVLWPRSEFQSEERLSPVEDCF